MSLSPKADGAIRLTDGRMLAYAEWGAADGTPVLINHGTPGSRLERHSPAEAYDRLGGRFIGVDRPGMGRSDPLPRRTILDWADDVVELADALRLGRFATLAEAIPDCRSVFYPGEGHLLIFEREEDILRTLVAAT